MSHFALILLLCASFGLTLADPSAAATGPAKKVPLPKSAAPVAAKATTATAPADRPPFPYPGDALTSTPGVSLRLVEFERKRTPGTVEVDYRLEAKGFPRGKVYRLWQMSLAGPAEALCGALVADSTGSLVPDAKAALEESSLCPPLSGIELGAYEYMPGEPYRVAILSTDDSVRAVATAFPHPIEGADGPHRMLLEMTSGDRRSFTLWGTGFGKDRSLTTSMTTEGGTYEGAAFSDADGNVRILLNAPQGESGGTVTYEVRGSAGRPRLTYRWGAAR
jgi:hypothetical protein